MAKKKTTTPAPTEETEETEPLQFEVDSRPELTLSNRSGQLLTFTIHDMEGEQHHRELQAGEGLQWPVCSLGPDVAAKVKARLLSIR